MSGPGRAGRVAGLVLVGLVASLVLIALASRVASSAPDGLEKVAADQGIDATARPHDLADGPFADYRSPGLGAGAAGAGVAGVVGLVLTFAAGSAVVVLARRRGAQPGQAER